LKQFIQAFGFDAYLQRLQIDGQIPAELSGASYAFFGKETENDVGIAILTLQLGPLLNRSRGLADAVDGAAKFGENAGSAIA